MEIAACISISILGRQLTQVVEGRGKNIRIRKEKSKKEIKKGRKIERERERARERERDIHATCKVIVRQLKRPVTCNPDIS